MTTLYGVIAGDTVVITDQNSGKPIVVYDEIVPPEGYIAYGEWEEYPDSIKYMWRLKPIEGTEQEAALALSKLQAKSLPDEYALQFTALYDEWAVGQTYRGPDAESGYAGDRIRYKGVLYRVLLGHVSQADWTPDTASSLYVKVLPGQDGNEPEDGSYAEWEPPGPDNGYSMGDRVTHNGKVWESTFDGVNIWEPGDQGTEALWKDVTEEVSA